MLNTLNDMQKDDRLKFKFLVFISCFILCSCTRIYNHSEKDPIPKKEPIKDRVYFTYGIKSKEAEESGADIVGSEDLVEKISSGDIDFERCIATPDMMPLVGRLGKVLGPKGLMPNPKIGTVTNDVADAVKSAKAGSVEYRNDKAGIIHAGVGKVSFSKEDLNANIIEFVKAVKKDKPSAAKGVFIKKVSLSSTMGAGLRIDTGVFN